MDVQDGASVSMRAGVAGAVLVGTSPVAIVKSV